VGGGRGLTTPIVFLREAQAPRPDARGDAPFTVQPPLYPLLLATAGGASPGHERAGRWLNVLAHVAICLCVLVLAWPAGPRTATAAGVATAVCGPLLHVSVGWVMSDALFLALFLVPLAAAAAARRGSPRAKHALHTCAGLAGALCVAVRYPGLALVVPLGWEAIRLARRAGWRRGVGAALELLAPLAICGGALLARNVQITGHLRGAAQHAPQRSLLDALGLLADQLAQQLTGLSALATLALVALALALPVGAAVQTARSRDEHVAPGLRGLDLLAAAALGYGLLLAWALRTEPQAEARYVLPWLPLLLAGAALVARHGQRLHAEAGRRGVGALGLALTALVLAGPNAVVAARSLPLPEQDFPYLYTETHRWVMEHLPRRAPVATNDAVRLSYFGEHPALALPTRAWDPAEEVPAMAEWLPARMKEIGAKHLVLLVGEHGLPPQGWGDYVAELSRRQALEPFERVWQGRDGVVYRLRD